MVAGWSTCRYFPVPRSLARRPGEGPSNHDLYRPVKHAEFPGKFQLHFPSGTTMESNDGAYASRSENIAAHPPTSPARARSSPWAARRPTLTAKGQLRRGAEVKSAQRSASGDLSPDPDAVYIHAPARSSSTSGSGGTIYFLTALSFPAGSPGAASSVKFAPASSNL
jgi:hypothetical protein